LVVVFSRKANDTSLGLRESISNSGSPLLAFTDIFRRNECVNGGKNQLQEIFELKSDTMA
jgi:hypothetical protein